MLIYLLIGELMARWWVDITVEELLSWCLDLLVFGLWGGKEWQNWDKNTGKINSPSGWPASIEQRAGTLGQLSFSIFYSGFRITLRGSKCKGSLSERLIRTYKWIQESKLRKLHKKRNNFSFGEIQSLFICVCLWREEHESFRDSATSLVRQKRWSHLSLT